MALQNETSYARGRWAFLGASINPETWRDLERFRGEIPRSRIVERALKQYLERQRETERLENADNNKA